jgi:hypothetical protein
MTIVRAWEDALEKALEIAPRTRPLAWSRWRSRVLSPTALTVMLSRSPRAGIPEDGPGWEASPIRMPESGCEGRE